MNKSFLFFIAFYSLISCNERVGEDYIKSGLAKAQLNDFKGAILEYDTAIKLSPESAEAYYYRANSKVGLEQFEGAIADYDTAISLDSSDAHPYYNRGNTKATLAVLKSNILDRMTSNFDDLDSIELQSSFYAVVYDTIDEKNYFISAISDFNKAISLDSNNENIYNYRGLAKGHLNDYRGAVDDFTKAIEINSKNTEAFRYRGETKIILGQKDSGCLDLSKSGELGDEKAYVDIKKYCN